MLSSSLLERCMRTSPYGKVEGSEHAFAPALDYPRHPIIPKQKCSTFAEDHKKLCLEAGNITKKLAMQ